MRDLGRESGELTMSNYVVGYELSFLAFKEGG